MMAAPLVGIDVGENSVGLASIECDDSGMPQRIGRLLVVIHDSGKDVMASGQTASVSRKASGGAARRVRRLLRNRRKRANRLADELSSRGYPLVDASELETYAEWRARSRLLRDYVTDDAERRRLISIAIRHMSNHRGWANAWVSLDSYVWKEEPSAEFEAAVAAAVAEDRFGELDPDRLKFQADLAELGLSTSERLRPRNPAKPSEHAVRTAHLLGQQRRVDVVREWRQICRVQRVPDEEFLALARIAFAQEKPKVPLENVGFDWLPGYQQHRRASIASLEHQEFQIRQTVANLAVRGRPGPHGRGPLTVDEQNVIIDHLMGVTKADEAPTWKEIAELFLGVPPTHLVSSEPDESLHATAPILRSAAVIHQLPKSHPVMLWWRAAPDVRRADFIRWLADPAKIEVPDEGEFEQLLDELSESETEALLKLKFPSGRSAHSVESLRLMSAEMQRTGDRYVTVRNRLFNAGEDLRPRDLQSLDTESDHPTLQRILPAVRRFLRSVEHGPAGPPRQVTIEHVRSAFLGFNARQELISEQRKNQRARQRAQEEIAAAGLGISHASDGMIRKFQAIQRQGSRCLYCGATLVWSSTEMDHIVPRKSGGNSTRANLVAVCRDCNAAKGKDPFAVFAQSGRRPGVSIDDAIERVRSLERGELDPKSFRRLKGEMIRRLKQTEEDEPIDERSLASTAYAAVDMVRRINTHYGDEGGDRAKVYSGRIVSMARHASGIDRKIRIRDGLDAKSRLDRRHHAIDAAVAALLNPSVARTLAEREDMRQSARNGDGDDRWKTYKGSSPAAVERFERWMAAMDRLAVLIREALDRDEVVVMQPVRFSAHHAALHEDGRAPHQTKRVGDAWTSAERALIVDDRVYEAISGGALPSADLPEDSNRSIRLPNGRRLDAEGKVFIFPDTAARLPLPNQSSARLGQSIHHARLYRWRDARGRVAAGVIRVWAADLYDLDGGVRADLLTAALRPSSRAVRRAKNVKLRDALVQGIAEHVGTFVVGDEILIDPAEWAGDNEPGRFLAEWPERHWRLAGLMSDSQFTMTPMYLSQEGVVREEEFDPDEHRRIVPVSADAFKVISDRLRISASSLWSTESTRVIRRTGSGAVREAPDRGLPASWSPYLAVHGS